MNPLYLSRRDLLKLGIHAATTAGALGTLGAFQRAMAASDTSGYKALVCLFLLGGNDGHNTLVPRDGTAYNTYAARRATLALARESLLAINPGNAGGQAYGLHGSVPGLQSLFESGRLAWVLNTGTLAVPTSVAQFRAQSVPLPLNLFSHNDQQQAWMTSTPTSTEPYGWAGRINDLLRDQGFNPQLSLNVSLTGSNLWQGGRKTLGYAMNANGAAQFNAIRFGQNGGASGRRADAFRALLAQGRSDANLFTQEFAGVGQRAIDSAEFVTAGLASVGDPATAFPSTPLGGQLRMVARMIRARGALQARRQMFFIGVGGYDTHDTQLRDQAARLSDLSQCVKAFDDCMVESGISNDVTLFSAADFGRTLTTNGDGSDHGWGNHHFVVGGAVRGKSFYGSFPDLAANSADDGGDGRLVPRLASDQYAATLARWWGVSDGDLDLVFPNLRNFNTRNLGFL